MGYTVSTVRNEHGPLTATPIASGDGITVTFARGGTISGGAEDISPWYWPRYNLQLLKIRIVVDQLTSPLDWTLEQMALNDRIDDPSDSYKMWDAESLVTVTYASHWSNMTPQFIENDYTDLTLSNKAAYRIRAYSQGTSATDTTWHLDCVIIPNAEPLPPAPIVAA